MAVRSKVSVLAIQKLMEVKRYGYVAVSAAAAEAPATLKTCQGSGLSLSSTPTQSPGTSFTVSSTEAPACPMFQM